MENNKDYVYILEKSIDKMDTMIVNLLMKKFDSGEDLSDLRSLLNEVKKLKTTVSLIK